MTEKLKNLIEDELESAFVHGRTEAESEYRDLLDKAKDEAYQRGYKDCETRYCSFDACPNRQAEYQRGLDDAWKAARKIINMPEGELLNIFTECYSAVCTALQVLLKYDASEAIEKLKAYEEKQDDKIEVGDEVEVLNSGSKYLIAWFAGTSICGFAHDGVTCRLQPSDVRKTGRHFDIASILEDLRND